MNDILNTINDILYGNILIYLLLTCGLYLTFATRFIQIRLFKYAFQVMRSSRTKADKSHISSFQAFCTSLAARIGTGNIAGVAIAIYLGGPGSVFWMWVTALIGMATSLSENILAQIYKTNNNDGTYRGGPAYYIEKALGLRWLGILFSIALISAYGFAFVSVQSNSIAAAFKIYGLSNELIGIILVIVSSLVVLGGIRSISKTAEKIVPFMAIFYFLISLVVILLNVSKIPATIELIFTSAFGLKSIAGGTLGATIANGIKRGLFSNEAGMGSSPNAAATSHSDHPVNQGLMGMIGVFFDTMVVCTATAMIILLSGLYGGDIKGVELTQASLAEQIGNIGLHFISIVICLFAFTTIIANYYFGENNVQFITRNKFVLRLYQAVFFALIYIGSVSSLPTVWNFADLSMGIMALINIFAILTLSSIVISVVKDFDHQLQKGISPVFIKSKFKKISTNIDHNTWQEHNK